MADVFVSYARSDKALVAPLVAAIENQGWSVWWDPAISPGQEFDRQITVELAAASAVLVVWTPRSVESRWVRGEGRDGADRGILVPVRFGDAVLPIDFRAFHTIDLDERTVAMGGPAFQEAVQAIGALVARNEAARKVPAAPRASVHAPAELPAAPRATVCVLPFSNLSADPEQAFLSDGITEDIITELSRWRRLAVRSRSASFRYRGGNIDLDQVTRELNVRFVVEGSVRRMGERIRISVKLIDVETGSQVWGEKFDRTQEELFTVQDRIVQQIVSTVVGRVDVTDVDRARRKTPANLDAYECVQKGNALPWDDPLAAAEAIHLFEKAIELDPGYGLAHALLATMRCAQWRNDLGAPDAMLESAFLLAKRAVELDDGESTCHSLLAHACLYRRSFEMAEQHMRLAVEINPNNQWNLADMGLVLTYVGRPEQALEYQARAREIDPYFDPPWHWRQAGQTQMVLHRFEEALSMFAHIPVTTFRTAAYLAACHARLGDMARAIAFSAECLSLRADFSIRRWMAREPYRREVDATYLAESFRLAGLPE